jgi:hypothetical protein
MGILSWLFGKRKRSSEKGNASMDLAFVLLSEARLPDAGEIAQAFRTFAAPDETLQTEVAKGEAAESSEVLMFTLGAGDLAFVALIPAAVPNGGAEDAAKFSLSSFGDKWKLPSHSAHLIVTVGGAAGTPPVARLSRFTSFLAAVVKSSPAVGVYCGNAGATHDPEFFVSVASEQGVVPRIMLWSGVSVAHEKDGRLSLLSLGMEQLGLPDLLLVPGESSADTAMEMMFEFLAYVADRGEAIPEGDTVGRTAEEQIPVRYVQSPIDSGKKVWRVELP